MNLLKSILEGITARLGGSRAQANISRGSDIALAMLIIGILAMIIIPINPHVIDYMLALNLSISVALLWFPYIFLTLSAFQCLPSLLLITTLYRLGTNIASTKQISSSCLCRRYYLLLRGLRCRG